MPGLAVSTTQFAVEPQALLGGETLLSARHTHLLIGSRPVIANHTKTIKLKLSLSAC